MQQLPKKIDWNRAQDLWAAIIDPVVSNPALNVSILKNQALTTGNNVLNHKLGRKLQGWYPVRFHGASASLYDLQDSNPTPDLTLVLHASSNVTIDLVVF